MVLCEIFDCDPGELVRRAVVAAPAAASLRPAGSDHSIA
jgi:hypothetical protein